MNSIEKALHILMVFAPENRPLRTVEIARKLEMNKATVNRILLTLKKAGFVGQDPATRRYRLGPAAAVLGRAVKQSLEGRLVELAKPHLYELRDKVGETVHLEVLYEDRIILTYSAKGPRQVIVSPHVGDRMAAHANAGAKAIMAFCSTEMRDKYLAGSLPKFTRGTVIDPGELRSQYQETRETGFAWDRGEYDDDVDAVAAPIFNQEDQVVAAVVLIAPSFRMKGSIESGALELLKDTAADISARLLQLKA